MVSQQYLVACVLAAAVALSVSGVSGQQVVAGTNFTCIAATDVSSGGRIICSGTNYFAQVIAAQSSSPFYQLAASSYSPASILPGSNPVNATVCALDRLGALTCYGDSKSDPVMSAWNSTLRYVSFAQIAMGNGFLCGVRNVDSSIQCGGNFMFTQSSADPNGLWNNSFSAVYANGDVACGTLTDGAMICWQASSEFPFLSPVNFRGVSSPPPRVLWSSQTIFSHVAVGTSGNQICAVVGDARVVATDSFEYEPDPQNHGDNIWPAISEFARAGDVVCWLRGDVSSQWNLDPFRWAPTPAVPNNKGFTQVMIGNDEFPGSTSYGPIVCGLGFDTYVYCSRPELTAAFSSSAASQLAVVSGTQYCAVSWADTPANQAVRCVQNGCHYSYPGAPYDPPCAPFTGFETFGNSPQPVLTTALLGQYRVGAITTACPVLTAFSTSAGSITPACTLLTPPGQNRDYSNPQVSVACEKGSYAPFYGSVCQSCPPGSYSNVVGSSTCLFCNSTMYNPSYGASSCMSCFTSLVSPGVTVRQEQFFPDLLAHVSNPSYAVRPIGYRTGASFCTPCATAGNPNEIGSAVNGKCQACDFDKTCLPGFLPINREFTDFQTLTYTDPLDFVQRDSADARDALQQRVYISAAITLGLLLIIGILLHRYARESAFVKLDGLWYVLPYTYPRREQTVVGATLTFMVITAAALILAASISDFRDTQIITSSLQPKVVPYRVQTKSFVTSESNIPPMQFWVSFLLSPEAMATRYRFPSDPASAYTLCNPDSFNVTFIDIVRDHDIINGELQALPMFYKQAKLDYMQPLPDPECYDGQPGRRCSLPLPGQPVCNVTLTCQDCTFGTNPRIRVELNDPTVTAATIRVGVNVPYFQFNRKHGGGRTYLSSYLATHVRPPKVFDTNGQRRTGVYRGDPTIVKIAMTTVVRADKSNLLAPENPIGLVPQLAGIIPGQAIGYTNIASFPAYSSQIAATRGVAVVLQFTKPPEVLVVRTQPAQTPLNLVGQLLSLCGTAFSIGLFALIGYQTLAFGKANVDASAGAGGGQSTSPSAAATK